MLQLDSILPVGDELGVHADGSEVGCGGTVEVEIEMGVLHLFFDTVAIGHSEKVLGAEG